MNKHGVDYIKCSLCSCGFRQKDGFNFILAGEGGFTITKFICDGCLDVIINSEKAEEWY